MSTSIGINPNLRVGDGNLTVADLDEDVLGDPPVNGAMVRVFVERADLVGIGWVEEIDEEDHAVIVRVDWRSLRRPSTVGVAAVKGWADLAGAATIGHVTLQEITGTPAWNPDPRLTPA